MIENFLQKLKYKPITFIVFPIATLALICLFVAEATPSLNQNTRHLPVYLWQGFLINTLFVALALDIILRRIPLWLLIVPLSYIGFFYWQKNNVSTELEKLQQDANKQIQLPFINQKNTIVSSMLFPLYTFDLSKMYIEQEGKYEVYYVISKNECSKINNEILQAQKILHINKTSAPKFDISSYQEFLATSVKTEPVYIENQKNCFVHWPEKPKLSFYKISTSWQGTANLDIPKHTALKILSPDGQKHELVIFTWYTLRKIPMPYFGCKRYSRTDDLKCSMKFQRDVTFINEGLPDELRVSELSKVFGWERVSATKRVTPETDKIILKQMQDAVKIK